MSSSCYLPLSLPLCHWTLQPDSHHYQLLQSRAEQVARGNIKSTKEDVENPSRSMGLQKGSFAMSFTADHQML